MGAALFPSQEYRLARLVRRYFLYFAPFFAFFPHCGASSRLSIVWHTPWTHLDYNSNKNALTAVFSLAWRLDREMRRRLILHEKGFTNYKFFTSSFIDVDTISLFLNWFIRRVSDDRKYVCGRKLYGCINIRKLKGLDSREITLLPEIKNVIYMACYFNHRRPLMV